MRLFVAALSVLALVLVASPASAAVSTYVSEGFEAAEGFPLGSQVDDNANWTQAGDSVPAGSVGDGNIVNTVVASGDQALEMVTTTDASLVRVRWQRDLTAPNASLSAATPMTSATVSLDLNYDFASWNKGWPEDVWIHVINGQGENVAWIRANSGVYDWKFGTDYKNGASASNVRNADWHTLAMDFDFGANTVTYFLDGVQEHVDNTLTDNGLTLDGTQGFDRVFVQNGIDQRPDTNLLSNVSYVDNICFMADIVPEPASAALIGLSTLLIWRRRRT